VPVWVKIVATLSPLLIGALVTVAWQNSHALAVLTLSVEHLRLDLERTRAALEPGRTIMLRLDNDKAEIQHLRELVEARLVCPPPSRER